jgi:ankyrin repeat protein
MNSKIESDIIYNRFVYACETGDILSVKELAKQYKLEYTKDESYCLRTAADNGHADIVEFLLFYGNPNVNALDGYALVYASMRGYVMVVDCLLKNGADVTLDHCGALRHACNNGFTEVVKLLIEYKVDVNCNMGYPLIVACYHGYTEMVQCLLDNGAYVNCLCETPLKWACNINNTDIVNMLLDKQIDVNAENGVSVSFACSKGNLDLVRLLVERGASITLNDGMCLRNAINSCNIDLILFLFQVASDKNTLFTSSVINKSFIDACKLKEVEIVSLLIQYGANVNANNGVALCRACYCGDTDIVELLLENGANVNGGDENERDIPIKDAVYEGHFEIVKLLVKYGANVHADNEYPLKWASYHNYYNIVQFLIDNEAKLNDDPDIFLFAVFNGCIESGEILFKSGANTNQTKQIAFENKNITYILTMIEMGVVFTVDEISVLSLPCCIELMMHVHHAYVHSSMTDFVTFWIDVFHNKTRNFIDSDNESVALMASNLKTIINKTNINFDVLRYWYETKYKHFSFLFGTKLRALYLLFDFVTTYIYRPGGKRYEEAMKHFYSN